MSIQTPQLGIDFQILVLIPLQPNYYEILFAQLILIIIKFYDEN